MFQTSKLGPFVRFHFPVLHSLEFPISHLAFSTAGVTGEKLRRVGFHFSVTFSLPLLLLRPSVITSKVSSHIRRGQNSASTLRRLNAPRRSRSLWSSASSTICAARASASLGGASRA